MTVFHLGTLAGVAPEGKVFRVIDTRDIIHDVYVLLVRTGSGAR